MTVMLRTGGQDVQWTSGGWLFKTCKPMQRAIAAAIDSRSGRRRAASDGIAFVERHAISDRVVDGLLSLDQSRKATPVHVQVLIILLSG